jgi:hypothetical protein
MTSVRIEKGVLISTYKQSRSHTYAVKNSSSKAKQVLIEHAIDVNWELQSPDKPDETTRNVYRFAVEAKPDESTKLAIVEQRTFHQNIALNNLDDASIQFYVSAKEVSEEVKEALREVVQRKTTLARLNQQAVQIQQEIATIGEEQERIRRNMESIDRNTDLYNRYVKKFTEQEDQIEKLRSDMFEVQRDTVAAQKSLDEYLSNLDLS